MKRTIIDPSQLELNEKVVSIKRVTKVVKGGRNMRFTALVVVGDGNGHVGAGLGKAAEIPEAIRKGKEDAMKKLIKVTLDENDSITHDYIGKFDVSDEELRLIKTELDKAVYDEYDRLIQLCDSLAGADGVLDVEDRMNDVKKRYGFYPQAKWDTNIRLMQHFEKKMNQNIYIVCEKDTFVPEDI